MICKTTTYCSDSNTIVWEPYYTGRSFGVKNFFTTLVLPGTEIKFWLVGGKREKVPTLSADGVTLTYLSTWPFSTNLNFEIDT